MTALRNLTGPVLLCLLASGCGSPIRWNVFQRDRADWPDDVSAATQDDAAAAESLTDQTRSDSGAGSTFAYGGHSLSENHPPLATPDSMLAPQAPQVDMEVPLSSRAVSLSGRIDIPPDSASDAQPTSSAAMELPSYEVPADASDDHTLASEMEDPSVATSDAAMDESPWALPRIPNVLDMSRLTDHASVSNWGWDLSPHLLPGTREETTASPDEPPLRLASLPETLPAESSVWGTSSAYSQEELSKLISLMETELAGVTPTTESERRDFIRRHVLLRNLYLLAGRPHDAQQAIPQIDPADQEFWSEMYWAMSSYFDEEMLPSRADRASQTVDRLASAQNALDPLVPLEIRNLQFCRRIDGFGNYEPFGINEFTPGQPLLLYIEVAHFLSEADPSGVHRTLLESEIEIYSDGATRELVDRTAFPSTEDLCRCRRDDYFHSYRIELPGTIEPGSYVLELTVEDRISGKTAVESRRFAVVSGSGLQ